MKTKTQDLTERIAKVTSTFLGFEDHGIFTFNLMLNYGDSGQGAGSYDLRGDWCAATLQAILRACGVDQWEKIKGRTIIALVDKQGFGLVRGIGPLPTEEGEFVLFQEVAQ